MEIEECQERYQDKLSMIFVGGLSPLAMKGHPYRCKRDEELCHGKCRFDNIDIRKKVIKKLLTMHYKAHSGHIGSSLSCVDILINLFFNVMKDEDIFVLSPGHKASALYAVLWAKGVILDEEIETYYKDGTRLTAHPPCNKQICNIIFGTGSLGHGLSISIGIASVTKGQVYCLLSEGDCQEGQTHEAALFIKQHKIKNLHIIVDKNQLQGLGDVNDILNVDDFISSLPNCTVVHTVKGDGVSFMEHDYRWHYLPMNKEQYEIAMGEVDI